MAPDVMLPSNTAQTFEKVTNCLRQDEVKDIILHVKKRFPGKLNQLNDDNFPDLLKGLYKLGDITEQDLSLISLITAKAEKNNEIQAVIEKYQPQEIRQFVGRGKDVEIVSKRLTMIKPCVPGVNLHGESGVGKTTLAQEVAKVLKDFKLITIDLRGIFEMENAYFHILKGFNLQAWDKDVGRLFSHLKSMEVKTLLILDNVEQFISKDAGDARAQFIAFLSEIAASQACGIGSLKLLLTSREQLNDKMLRLKMFSEHKVEPFDQQVSKDFLSPTELKETHRFSKEVEDPNLLKIAKLCRNIPYLLKAAKRMLREGFRKPSEILVRLNTQLERGVPVEYVCMAEQFDTIPNNNLKELAVKLSLLQQPFSVSTAMKIANISSKDDATIDLELLLGREVISLQKAEGEEKADEGKHKYDVHDQFHEFVQKCLCENQTHFKDIYQDGQKQFFIHFCGKLSKLSHLMDREFVKAYTKLEKNRANFEQVIDISKSRSEVLDILLHSDQHNEAALFGILFEVLKDLNERKKLYSHWAKIAEKSENWSTSAQLRSWQALQGADMEGTHDANKALDIAQESLRKAEEKQLQQEQQQPPQQPQLEQHVQQHVQQQQEQQRFDFAKSLFLYARGKIKWLHASNLVDKKKRDRKKVIKEGINDLQEALRLSEKVTKGEASTMTARIINQIGNCYMELNKPDQAEGSYVRALDIKRKLVGSDENWEIANYYNQIAQVHERRNEYQAAVDLLTQALELQERLGVSDTEHTATLQRNLANSLTALKEYDKALKYANKAYENRKRRLGEHPETVRILYMTGNIHKHRKDFEMACKTYEYAFEMEEALPEYNHSVRRLDIRRELKGMYKKLKLKKEEKEFELRIKEIEETKKEVPGPAEVVIIVNQQGGKYNHLAKGFLLDFPPECVTEATRIHCEASSSISNLPSPNDSTETLVSYIVELGPDSIQLKKPFVMTLLHCGVSESKGYETKVKVFNTENMVWEEVEELPQASQPPENIQSSFIEVQLNKMSAVAVVSRLIITSFEVPISGCVVTSKIFSDVIVSFPEGAVDRTTKGCLQVIPIPGHVAEDSEAIPCPVLLFSGFGNVFFSKFVHITVPRPLHSKCTGVRVLRLDDVRTPPFLWKDITTKDIIVETKKTAITIQVKRFCGLWIWATVRDGLKDLKDLAYNLYKQLCLPPFYVSFAAYQNAGTTTRSKFDLKLTCVANHMQHDLTQKLKDEGYLHLKNETSDETMRKGEEAYPDFKGAEKIRCDVKGPLKFPGSGGGAFEKIFVLKTNLTEIRLSFYRDKEKKTSLCNLPLEKKEVNNRKHSGYCRDDQDSIDVYRMKSTPRGLMIIINIRKFVVDPDLPDHEKLKKDLVERTGSKKDVDKLKELFGGYLQFKVHILKPEVKRHELLTELKEIANKSEYKNYDCFALCIMSHGKGNEFYNYDGRTIKTSAIFNMLSNSQCENYRGKPKLFFIQACRGELEDEKRPVADGKMAEGGLESFPPNDMADMLLAHSSFEDYPSFRYPEKGSVFIQSLVSVFEEYADEEDILHLMTRVNNQVYSLIHGSFEGLTQVPAPIQTLRKKLYFWPGENF